jgi:polyisoprenoid-binding protein YceI
MNCKISSTSSQRHGAMAVLRKGGRAVITMAGVFVISGALLTGSGCDRSSGGSSAAVGAAATVDPNVALSSTRASDPSAVQYVTSVDPGQALVSGTSTLHDWTVKSTVIKGNVALSGKWKADSASTIVLQSIDLVIPVDSLKSTEGSGMDKTMYDALKLNQFPTITYSLTKASPKTPPSGQSSTYHFDATGQLTVGGATHSVDLDLAIAPREDGGMTITTDIGMKMSDFGIKPPTAMLGVIKSGDAITVKVNWQLAMRSPTATAEK